MNGRRFALALVSLAVIAVVALVVGRTLFLGYLKSDGFRQKISAATGRTLKAEGQFQPLQLAGATVYCDGFAARGNGGAFFSTLDAAQLRADFNWRGLLRRVWQIDELSIERLNVALRSEIPAGEKPATQTLPSPRLSGWKMDLRQAVIRDSHWSWSTPPGGITGTALTLTPSGDAWLTEAQGGKLTQQDWPELVIEKARLRYQSPSLFISESTLRSGEGTLNVSGEVRFEESADFQVKLARIDLAPLLDPDWRARIKGDVSGDVKIHAPLGDDAGKSVVATGSLRLGHGRLEALPVLNQIALFTQTQRFRKLNLTNASMDFSRDAERLSATNVVLETEGLLRIEGAFTVVGGSIDGTFQVGVTPASLQWLPGSSERVFTTARGGYLWAPMRLTGPAAHPTEDLTPRLVTAAAGETLKNVEDTVRDAAKGLLDLLKP